MTKLDKAIWEFSVLKASPLHAVFGAFANCFYLHELFAAPFHGKLKQTMQYVQISQ